MIPTNVWSSTTMQYLSYKQGNKTTHQETSPKSSCEEYKILTEQSQNNMFYWTILTQNGKDKGLCTMLYIDYTTSISHL